MGNAYEQLFGSMFDKKWNAKSNKGGFRNTNKALNFIQQSYYAPPAYVPPPPTKETLGAYKAGDFYITQSDMWAHASELPINYRNLAMHRLWKGVAAGIVVRHPDPKVPISLYADSAGSVFQEKVTGRFVIGAADTRNPNNKVGTGFHMPWTVKEWPGQRCAELFFTGAWMTYLAHEALELVSNVKLRPSRDDGYRNTYPYEDHDRVVDPHNDTRFSLCKDHWLLMDAIMYGTENYANKATGVQCVLESCFGVAGLTEYRDAQSRAKQELSNEAQYMQDWPNGEPGV